MKKLLILAVLSINLVSCGSSNDEYNNAKNEFLNGTNSQIDQNSYQDNSDIVSNSSNNENNSTISNIENDTKGDTNYHTNGKQVIKTSVVSGNSPTIEITNLDEIDAYTGEFRFKGKTLGNVDKIVVDFSNESSDYPNDSYTLKEFKSGDSTFRYLASDKYSTLDYGLNTYIFSAYSGDEVYKFKIELEVPENKIDYVSNSDGEGVNQISGTGETIIEYTNSMGDLQTQKKDVSEIKCENLTDYLVENYGYIYRGRCRDIVENEIFGYYVLRLSGDNFYFEKHYVDYVKGEYSVLPLASGKGITKDTIGDEISTFVGMDWEKVSDVDKSFKN